MDRTINVQINTKAILKIVTMIFAITLVLSITLSNILNTYAVPPERIESCESEYNDGQYICCWTETDPADPEKIEIYKCQYCILKNGVIDCTPVRPDPSPSPTREEDISPGDSGVIEQPPSENTPPIRSDNSVSPNEDSTVIDESQSTNPTFESNKGNIIDENLAQDQPMQFSSNVEQTQQSEESTEENNADASSNSQENDDWSTSETTTSLWKRVNTQNSPVPPEIPKQGPIPPDCNMKPKF